MAESESIHDLLECSICHERFTQPKMLPCQHTFCLNCLRGITKDARTLNCPLCRERHHVPRNGIPGFKDNLVIKDLLLIVGDSAECHDCKKTQILTRCSHCEQQVCEICREDHERLQTEITTLLQSYKYGILQRTHDDKTDWQTALDNTLEEEAKVKRAFKEAVTALLERREQLLRPIQNTARLQKALIEKNEGSIIEQFQQELRSCETVESLRVFQESLLDAAKVLSSIQTLGIGPKFSCNMSDIAEFGQVVCGDKTLSNKTTNVPLAARDEKMTNETPHASSVDYKSKNSSWKRIITRHPDQRKKFNPTFALYSHHNDSILCISTNNSIVGTSIDIREDSVFMSFCKSNNKLLLFDKNGGDEKTIFPAVSVRHLAITESGQLLFTDGKNVMRADLNKLEDADPAYSRIKLRCSISRASQLCCYKGEFVVLDSLKKCLIAFTEDGKISGPGQFTIGEICVSENSRMCVDREGRIYITSAYVTGREESNDVLCTRCCKSKYVTVAVKSVIVVLSWEGDFLEEIEIDRRSETFNYTFRSLKCVHGYVARNDSSVPSDDNIIRENSIRGICVDIDGFISITRAGKIDVYNPKRELHCTIGDPMTRSGEFKEPSGVNMMPDGRRIVCDTGNNRIQMISSQRLDFGSPFQFEPRIGVRRRALRQTAGATFTPAQIVIDDRIRMVWKDYTFLVIGCLCNLCNMLYLLWYLDVWDRIRDLRTKRS